MKSAMSANAQRTSERIVRCAQDLAAQRGLDGFTMDDLAECAGVSRRTLFNYVGGKIDAVLGAPPEPDPARLDPFRSGGPTGRLAADLKLTIGTLLEAKLLDPAELERMRQLIGSDARLHKALHDKFARVAELIADAIVDREGSRFTAFQAHAASTVTLSLFDLALEAFADDPTTSLAEHFRAAFDGADLLFG